MSYVAYRAALLNIATSEAGGEDVESEINRLAMSTGMERTTVRQDVTEMADLHG